MTRASIQPRSGPSRNMAEYTSEYYIGLMTGTSLDAVDAVLVDFATTPPRLLAHIAPPLAAGLRQAILALCQSGEDEIERMGRLDRELGQLYADTVIALLRTAAVTSHEIRAIGCHGQTIRHRPEGPWPFTLQIGDPATLALSSGITTVAQFRQGDIAAGGQGAPLVPAFHRALFQHPRQHRVVVNIGGIANITLLPAGGEHSVTGFDTGPGNLLLDAWIGKHRSCRFDEAGAWASQGQIHEGLLAHLLADPYFQAPPPKSTGREYFNLAWLETRLRELPPISAQDVQTTLTELTALSLARAIRTHAPQSEAILICGGGHHNRYLLQRLQQHLPGIHLASTAEHGVDPDWVEAMAFAWLARQCLQGKPGNLPSATGARREVVLGAIYSPAR